MRPEHENVQSELDPNEPGLHLEFLYGPQWLDVARIIERATQLTAGEREQLNAVSGPSLHEGLSTLSGDAGLAGLLSSFGGSSADSPPARIAAVTAREFGRARHLQLAGMIAGQVVTPRGDSDFDDLSGMLKSFGALIAVNRAVTAAALGDLIGQGAFTREVYDALMRPWSSVIG